MIRAGVFIGVKKTGGLTELHDATANAQRMHQWAIGQGMEDGKSAILLTDDSNPEVTALAITKAVTQVINDVSPEQLILYFAGHGVLARFAEQWLLSNAPEVATEAIDVRETIELARMGSVPHVVVISDACRTAPEGIQAQNVDGGPGFPNDGPSGNQSKVDVYYACAVGRPSAEIQTLEESVMSYRGVFTEVLLDALNGSYSEAFLSETPEETIAYVSTRKLEGILAEEVPRRIRSKNLKARYSQNPWAEVVSSDDKWISQIRNLPETTSLVNLNPTSLITTVRTTRAHSEVVGDVMDLDIFELNLPNSVAPPPYPTFPDSWENMSLQIHHRVNDEAKALSPDFGPQEFESKCGVKVRGAQLIEYYSHAMYTEETMTPVSAIGVDPGPTPITIILRFDNERVTALPLVPEFITALEFEGEELISVSYEPSMNSSRWADYQDHKEEIRQLRSTAASASAQGVFRLPMTDDDIPMQMLYGSTIDPALALYAAHSYYAAGRTERISEMSGHLQRDLGITFFDFKLLTHNLVHNEVAPSDPVLPCTPLLTQSWSIIRAHGTRLPASLAGIDTLATNSLWSSYLPEAFNLFRNGLIEGELE